MAKKQRRSVPLMQGAAGGEFEPTLTAETVVVADDAVEPLLMLTRVEWMTLCLDNAVLVDGSPVFKEIHLSQISTYERRNPPPIQPGTSYEDLLAGKGADSAVCNLAVDLKEGFDHARYAVARVNEAGELDRDLHGLVGAGRLAVNATRPPGANTVYCLLLKHNTTPQVMETISEQDNRVQEGCRANNTIDQLKMVSKYVEGRPDVHERGTLYGANTVNRATAMFRVNLKSEPWKAAHLVATLSPDLKEWLYSQYFGQPASSSLLNPSLSSLLFPDVHKMLKSSVVHILVLDVSNRLIATEFTPVAWLSSFWSAARVKSPLFNAYSQYALNCKSTLDRATALLAASSQCPDVESSLVSLMDKLAWSTIFKLDPAAISIFLELGLLSVEEYNLRLAEVVEASRRLSELKSEDASRVAAEIARKVALKEDNAKKLKAKQQARVDDNRRRAVEAEKADLKAALKRKREQSKALSIRKKAKISFAADAKVTTVTPQQIEAHARSQNARAVEICEEEQRSVDAIRKAGIPRVVVEPAGLLSFSYTNHDSKFKPLRAMPLDRKWSTNELSALLPTVVFHPDTHTSWYLSCPNGKLMQLPLGYLKSIFRRRTFNNEVDEDEFEELTNAAFNNSDKRLFGGVVLSHGHVNDTRGALKNALAPSDEALLDSEYPFMSSGLVNKIIAQFISRKQHESKPERTVLIAQAYPQHLLDRLASLNPCQSGGTRDWAAININQQSMQCDSEDIPIISAHVDEDLPAYEVGFGTDGTGECIQTSIVVGPAIVIIHEENSDGSLSFGMKFVVDKGETYGIMGRPRVLAKHSATPIRQDEFGGVRTTVNSRFGRLMYAIAFMSALHFNSHRDHPAITCDELTRLVFSIVLQDVDQWLLKFGGDPAIFRVFFVSQTTSALRAVGILTPFNPELSTYSFMQGLTAVSIALALVVKALPTPFLEFGHEAQEFLTENVNVSTALNRLGFNEVYSRVEIVDTAVGFILHPDEEVYEVGETFDKVDPDQLALHRVRARYIASRLRLALHNNDDTVELQESSDDEEVLSNNAPVVQKKRKGVKAGLYDNFEDSIAPVDIHTTDEDLIDVPSSQPNL